MIIDFVIFEKIWSGLVGGIQIWICHLNNDKTLNTYIWKFLSLSPQENKLWDSYKQRAELQGNSVYIACKWLEFLLKKILVLHLDMKQRIFIWLFVSILLLHPYWALENRFLNSALRSTFGNKIIIFIKLLIINSFLIETNKNWN